MKDYKSVQDLIVKAALYDGVTTTIRPESLISGDTLSIRFSRNNRHAVTHICVNDKYGDSEESALYGCKHALLGLLVAPYEEIGVNKKNNEKI